MRWARDWPLVGVFGVVSAVVAFFVHLNRPADEQVLAGLPPCERAMLLDLGPDRLLTRADVYVAGMGCARRQRESDAKAALDTEVQRQRAVLASGSDGAKP